MKKPVYDTSPYSTSYADLIKKMIDDYSSGKGLTFWFLGSAILISTFLITQTFSKQNVYFPFFQSNSNGVLKLTLNTSNNIGLQMYESIGTALLTFNNLLRVLVLAFVSITLVKTLLYFVVFPFVKFLIQALLLILPFIENPFLKIINKIPRSFYEKKWVAQPQALDIHNDKGRQIFPPLRRKIPKDVRNFQHISFKIHILGDFPHWRAGIFITSFDPSKDYVFHIYKNKEDNRIFAKMTKRKFSKGHINEINKDLSELMTIDLSKILFMVKKVKKNTYSLIINGQEIDRYDIPKNDFKHIELGAWADDEPYKIEFENIKYEG